MASKKDIIKKRWLLGVAYLFQIILPLVLVFSIMVKSDKAQYVKLPCAVMVLGILYLAFIAKLVKNAAAKLKNGVLKIFLTEVNFLIPFIVVGIITYLSQVALQGFDHYMWWVCAFVAIGSLIKMIEWMINKDFIKKQELYKMAQQQIELEKAKKELEEEIEDETV